MTNVLDCDILLIEFVLQSCNYILFKIKILGKDMNPYIPPAMGEIVTLLFF